MFVVLNDFEEISTGTVLSDFPHVIFGFHKIVELDDVGMVEFGKYFGLIVDFSFSCFLESFDGDKLKFFFLASLEYDGILSLCFLFVNVVVVHFEVCV